MMDPNPSGSGPGSRPWRATGVGANVLGVRRWLLRITRVWLPLAIAIAGAVLIGVGHGHTATAAAGVGLLLVALTV
jgi:hypothetical protein